MDTNANPDTAEQPENESNGYAIVPMAAAAALDASAFSKVNAMDAVPITWEGCSKRALSLKKYVYISGQKVFILISALKKPNNAYWLSLVLMSMARKS